MRARIEGMPTSVLVLGQRFKVNSVKGLKVTAGDAIGDEHSDIHSLDVLGVCDSDTQVIAIEAQQGADHYRATFLHENLHAVLAMAGLREELGEHEEDIVKRVAPILLDWLRRNPKAIEFLTGKRLVTAW